MTSPNSEPKPYQEKVLLGDLKARLANLPQGSYAIEFNRHEALPPDEVTVEHGIEAGGMLLATDTAMEMYGFGEAGKTKRVLDLGCGVGTFLVSAIAGSGDLPVEITGLDIDSNALSCARSNLEQAFQTARAISPGRQLEMNLLDTDWADERFWEACGNFDFIYLNPPYLPPNTPIRQSGYEAVPLHHFSSSEPLKIYERLLPNCLGHLAIGGSLMMRSSSRGPLGIINLAAKNAASQGMNIEAIDCFKPYEGDRQGIKNIYTRLPDDWPSNRVAPWWDPRVTHKFFTGEDIGAC